MDYLGETKRGLQKPPRSGLVLHLVINETFFRKTGMQPKMSPPTTVQWWICPRVEDYARKESTPCLRLQTRRRQGYRLEPLVGRYLSLEI
jgi:hypothetical protein